MTRSSLPLLLLVLGILLFGVACGTDTTPTATALPVAEPEVSPQQVADAHEPEPAPIAAPTIATGDQRTADGAAERIAASHILVAHEAANRRPMHVHRSASAARAKAEGLLARLEEGADFAALAREESDCTTAPRGGFLGGFDRDTMDPAFETAAFALGEGQISGVVETPFGFHIIRRELLAEIRVAQILVGFAGSQDDTTGRSRELALERATLARTRLDHGEPFGTVAAELSDGAAGIRGGDLGWFTRGQFLPAWEDRAFALEPGDTAGPFETAAGFHVIRRLE